MKILLIEDHKLVRDALVAFLESVCPGIEVEEVGCLEEGVELLLKQSGIELVLLDLGMPKIEGLDGIGILKKRFPKIPIIILSARSDKETILEAMEKGAEGYIPKTLSGRVMIRAMELVLAGEKFIPSAVIDENRGDVDPSGTISRGTTELNNLFVQLTPRQKQILGLLILGKANKEIGSELGIKEITVGYHLKGLFRQLGAENRTQVVATALQLGWKG